jgi:hypothetical protein
VPHDVMKVSLPSTSVVSLPVIHLDSVFLCLVIAVIAFCSFPLSCFSSLYPHMPEVVGLLVTVYSFVCTYIATFHYSLNFFFNFLTDGRRNARSVNQVIRRFMQDLLQTVSNRYVEFVSSEWRGTLSDFRLERQLSLLKRRIARWYFAHP